MDLDFKRFSPRSFELFAQSLAGHVLGPGIAVFGDGPDGGREASYDGSLPFPSVLEPWCGYTVIQAKFLQVPGSPREQADWLAAQLDVELSKFARKDSRLRKPDHYILVTNARLSPMPAGPRGAGGIAKVEAVFERYRKRLGLRDFRIWHFDQLNVLLAGAPAIRRSFRCWVTSNEVIATLLDDLELKTLNFGAALRRYLQRELRDQRPMRLQQAGHNGDALTMIEDVFIDLPFIEREEPGYTVQGMLLSYLLELSRERLNATGVADGRDGDGPRRERVLLLGGPGQGKSTVSQFVAQLFRADLLSAEKAEPNAIEIEQIIESTRNRAQEARLPIDLPRRFPLRIDLPAFADEIVKPGNDRLSLISYIAAHMSRVADTKVGVDDLRRWLDGVPVILILDGLDEVPPSANRTSVIRAINEFWDDAARADLLMIVTTRPQGYNDDLDPNLYTRLALSELDAGRASLCAQKLANARLTNPLERERALARFADAAKNSATARLMTSPLQVAILLALLDQSGYAPNDRWSLFDQYYLVVLRREQAKPGPIGQLMKRWERTIKAVHERAGFLLQVEAETQGAAEAYLSAVALESLIRGQLLDEDFQGEELAAHTADLVSISTERLVLLTQRDENRYTYEVRSLQEYMAAAYLMSGHEAAVQDRLRAIASRSHWAHVFQIAASKCFALTDTRQYRDTIVTICNELNDSDDPIDRILRSGSRLANDLLDDGIAFDQPRYRKLLLAVALEVVECGPDGLPLTLCTHCLVDIERSIEALRRCLDSRIRLARDGAWTVLFRIDDHRARALVQERWPAHLRDEPGLIVHAAFANHGIVGRLEALVGAAEPVEAIGALDHARRLNLSVEAACAAIPVLRLFSSERIRSEDVSIGLGSGATPLSLSIIGIDARESVGSAYKTIPAGGSWEPLRALAAFHAAPCSEGLAELVEAIGSRPGWRTLFQRLKYALPWPLATAAYLYEAGVPVETLVTRIRRDDFGQVEDWHAAETRWHDHGLGDRDLAFWAQGVFFDQAVAAVGGPWAWMLTISSRAPSNEWMETILSLAVIAPDPAGALLRRLARFSFSTNRFARDLTVAEAVMLLKLEHVGAVDLIDPGVLAQIAPETLSDPAVLASMEARCEQGYFYQTHDRLRYFEAAAIASEIARHLETRPALAWLIACLCSADPAIMGEVDLSIAELEHIRSHDDVGIADAARILLALMGHADAGDLATILARTESRSMRRLFERIIGADSLERMRAIELGRSIASALLADSNIDRTGLIVPLQKAAPRRQSALDTAECWRALGLDETLYAQLAARRSVPEVLSGP